MSDRSFENAREALFKALTEIEVAAPDDAKWLRAQLLGPRGQLRRLTNAAAGREVELKSILDIVHQRLWPPFDEFKLRHYADWKRVRAAIEHENNLTNHRLTWLLTSQAALLTAYTVTFNAWVNIAPAPNAPVSAAPAPAAAVSTAPVGTASMSTAPERGAAVPSAPKRREGELYPLLLPVIALLGIAICLAIRYGLRAAERQLWALEKWWKDNREQDRSPLHHPPLQGEPSKGIASVLATGHIPIFFALVWLALVIVTLSLRLNELFESFKNLKVPLPLVLVFAVLFVLGAWAFPQPKLGSRDTTNPETQNAK